MTNVGTAERILGGNARYHFFRPSSSSSSLEVVRLHADQFELPEELRVHVDFVAPTTRFPRIQSMRRVQPSKVCLVLFGLHDFRTCLPFSSENIVIIFFFVQSNCPCSDSLAQLRAGDNGVTPSFLRNIYNVGDYRSKAKNNSVACTGFLEQYEISTTMTSSLQFDHFDFPPFQSCSSIIFIFNLHRHTVQVHFSA